MDDMKAELSAELEESVSLAAEQWCSEQQLADQLTKQLHDTVTAAAAHARTELEEAVSVLRVTQRNQD